jgi:perosamine synthetase
MGVMGVFSFHPRKTITTGEGGMVTTNQAALAAEVAQLRNHGAAPTDEERQGGPHPYLMGAFDVLGFNYRMSELQAAVGLVQLAKLDAFVDERARLADLYRRGLAGLDWLRLPEPPPQARHGWQSFVCAVDEARAPLPRNALMQALADRGIETRPGTHAIHTLGYYQERFGTRPDDLPGARDAARSTMALPMHNRLSEADVGRVVDTIRGITG